MIGAPAMTFEAVEDASDLVFRDADAVILDPEDNIAALAPAGEPHRAIDLREADGI